MITLGSTLPVIVSGETLTIQGSTLSLPGITIDGGGTVQLMIVSSGATLNLQFLTLADGSVTGVTGGAGFGGAIYNDGTVTVFDSTFSANQATGGASASVGGNGDGGAISNFGMLTVTNSTFSANQATGGTDSGAGIGGAILNSGTATVTNSTFSTNQATGASPGGDAFGGAIFNNSGTVTVLTVTNSTFSANQTTNAGAGFGFGGAIYNLGTATVTNSTFSANQATTGAGGAVDGAIIGTVSLKGTILAASAPDNCGGTVTDAGYNISSDASCGFAKTGSADNGDGVNPQLASGLAFNGGPTETFALLAGSPAIDQIPTSPTNECTDASSNPLTTDQRGEPRPDPGDGPNAPCDIGAYEFQDPIPPTQVLDTYKVSYFDVATAFSASAGGYGGAGNSGGTGDALLRIVDAGNFEAVAPAAGITAARTSTTDSLLPFPVAGDVCANIYVYNDVQEQQECCSCPLTANSLQTFSVINNLTSNPFNPRESLSAGVIKIVGSSGACSNSPTATTAAGPYTIAEGLHEWINHTEKMASNQASFKPTPFGFITSTSVNAFANAGLDAGELANLQGGCAAINNANLHASEAIGICVCGKGD